MCSTMNDATKLIASAACIAQESKNVKFSERL